MSLQDKISSAKPTNFLTNGLSEEEVKQAVDEGRKRRMSDTVKLIIEISKEHYQATKALNKRDPYLLSGGETAIAHGIPLDDVKAEIDRLPDLNPDYPMDKTIHISKWNVMRILDNIGKESEDEE